MWNDHKSAKLNKWQKGKQIYSTIRKWFHEFNWIIYIIRAREEQESLNFGIKLSID